MHGVHPDTIIDGRYRVLDRLGSGGMADVYCAEDQQLGRRVALKLLYRRFAEDDLFVERFRREASAAAGLQHPNIVSVYDRGEWDGTYYIAMEYLEGRTLKDLIREHGPMPPDLAIDVTCQILRAARFAHKRGVVHRDIKPQNVILDEEGRAKVTDFGIARAGASDMTETGSIMGTAQYLSPEQAQGHPVDQRSDLYSVGIVLYELLTGQVPFEAESAVTVALKQVNEVPVPPGNINPTVPPALEAVVMRALEKEPAYRFADADDFIAGLQAARAGAPAPVAGAAAPLAAPPAGGRSRGPWLALLAVLALAALGVLAYALLRPAQAVVPTVVNQRAAAAAQQLQNRGFEVDIERSINEDQPRDRVYSQDPRGGSTAREGSTVTLLVSDGPGDAAVPAVRGLPRAQASKALQDAGFDPQERLSYSDELRAGRVIDVAPGEGTRVEKGSKVTLTVSRGSRPVPLADVTGMSETEARDTLQAAGLTVKVRKQVDDTVDPGTVLSQDPAGGGTAARGSTVTITVAKAPPEVAVPDVSSTQSTTESEARDALGKAGLAVRRVRQQVDTSDQDGVVLSQTPTPGTKLKKGEKVTIVVGRFVPPPLEPGATPTPTPTP
jgi:serine/threonine-protein kinase